MTLLETLPVGPDTRQWPVWGTTARIVVTDPALATDAHELVTAELTRVDDACNRFRDDSELSRLVARARTGSGGPVEVSPVLADLLAAALRAAERTEGDVDPMLGDDLAALGYDRDYAQIVAGGVRIRVTERVRPRWRDLVLEGDTVTLPAWGSLDLGATAKAVAADRAASRTAERLGCGVLVALGGDIATAGAAPTGGWQVLVQDGPSQPASRISLNAGSAVATSSTLSRRWRHGTRLVHHVLDPRTGRSAETPWRTVSVVARSALDANTVSTAAIVRGWEALPWVRRLGYASRFVSSSGDVVRMNGWPAEESVPLPRGA